MDISFSVQVYGVSRTQGSCVRLNAYADKTYGTDGL